jgi:hypothetical protein
MGIDRTRLPGRMDDLGSDFKRRSVVGDLSDSCMLTSRSVSILKKRAEREALEIQGLVSV